MSFHGSQSRARAGMAQAILTLDNSDGWLPIDFTDIVLDEDLINRARQLTGLTTKRAVYGLIW